MKRPTLRTIVLALALIGVPGLVLAPDAAAQQQRPEQPQQQIEVSDDELESFAKAYLAIQEVRQRVETQMQEAESPQEAQQLQQQGNAEMVQIVEDHDLEVQRYSQIGTALNQDPELSQRFRAIMEELREEGGPSR